MSTEKGGRNKSEFTKGLITDAVSYICAFGAAVIPFILIDDIFAASAAFTETATALLFVVSVIFSDVSVYDPYWSVAPPVIILAAMIKYGLWNVNSVTVLILISVWSTRLTANWLSTYKGLGHEDWRYNTYRRNTRRSSFSSSAFSGFISCPPPSSTAGS